MFKKISGLIRFWTKYPFLKKAGLLNLIYFTQFVGKCKIIIGNRNKFYNCVIDAGFKKDKTIKIGDNNVFDYFSIIRSQSGNIDIGDNNFFGPRTQCQGYGGVEIGNGVMIAANTFISSSNHDFTDPGSEDYLKSEIGEKTIIEDNVWICANCVITAGVKLGKCSIIGAGSVVTKDVEPYTMVVGVPAKAKKKYSHEKNEWLKI